MSNLKQSMLAMLQYSDDYDEYIFLYSEAATAAQPPVPFRYYWTGRLYYLKYLSEGSGVISCPKISGKGELWVNSSSDKRYLWAYGAFVFTFPTASYGKVITTDTDPIRAIITKKVKNSSTFPIFGDSWNGTNEMVNLYSGSHPDIRHSGKMNTAFMDGHVSAKSIDEMDACTSASLMNRFTKYYKDSAALISR